MLPPLLGLIAGLGLLYAGAEALVRGGSRLAGSLGVSPLVIGLTVVAFGTSFPELCVSVIGAARSQSDVAAGNVIGSNIFNVAVILGLSAVVRPLRIQLSLLRLEMPIMLLVSVGLALLLIDRQISRVDASVLLLGFLAYVAVVLRGARGAPVAVEAEFREFEPTTLAIRGLGRVMPSLGLIAVGLGALVAGAQSLVLGATTIARGLGISELVIGLTVVAVGTSLPELATSLMAALRNESDIAVGNIVGSNIFNILAILGVASLVRPLEAAPALLRFDVPVMIAIAVALVPLSWTGSKLDRWEGGLLAVGYAAYLGFLLTGAAG